MPNVMSLAVKLGTRAYEKLHLEKDVNRFVLGSGVLAGLTKFISYEISENAANDFPAPVLPASKPKQKYQEPINPVVKTVLEPLQEENKKSVERSRESYDWKFTDLQSTRDKLLEINTGLKDNASDSPFLQNQVAHKDSFDSIALNLEAQTILLSSLWESLENNLSALVAVKMVEAQNAKVNTDYQKTISAQADMGQFFYEFIPTSEYWAKADTAQILFDARNNWVTMDSNLPSRMYASDEIALIDSLEGYYTNAQIRSKVEDFRKERLGSDIRALIGQTAISQVKDQADTNAKAREYYASASQSLKSKEVPKALSELVTAVAPIAQWADKAKVREEFLSTPSVIKDLDGNTIAQTSPMELSATKDATIAREKTDTINFEVDESDFPLMDFLPVLPFVGREYVFNPDFSLPTANPFTHKSIT